MTRSCASSARLPRWNASDLSFPFDPTRVRKALSNQKVSVKRSWKSVIRSTFNTFVGPRAECKDVIPGALRSGCLFRRHRKASGVVTVPSDEEVVVEATSEDVVAIKAEQAILARRRPESKLSPVSPVMVFPIFEPLKSNPTPAQVRNSTAPFGAACSWR